MDYAAAAYFDGNHCQHVADWQEAKRLARIRESARGLAVYAARHYGRREYA